MRLSSDESRAIGFVALVLALAAIARLTRPAGAPDLPATPLDSAALVAVRAGGGADTTATPEPHPIDPNTAGPAELERLPGVGRALAQRIIAERERGGPFTHVDDLTRVPGIGPRLAARLAPALTLPAGAHAPATDYAHANAHAYAPGRGLQPAAVKPGGAVPILGNQGEGREAAGAAGPRLEINRASAEELERLPGIGPALARRIVAYRDTAGPFQRLEELDRVPGIGPALLARLAPLLRFPS